MSPQYMQKTQQLVTGQNYFWYYNAVTGQNYYFN